MRAEAAALGMLRDELGYLHGLAALATLVDDLIAEAVTEARDEGYPWAPIGQAIGMTKQAVQQRYGKRVLGAGVGTVRAGGGD